MRRFIIPTLVILLVTGIGFIGFSNTYVFLKTPTLDIESITINYAYPTNYVHAGIIANGLVIEAGPWGLHIKEEMRIDYEHAVLYKLGKDMTRGEAREKALKVYEGSIGWDGVLKVTANLMLPGKPFKYHGQTCFDFVGAFLGVEAKKPITPLDILAHVPEKGEV